MAFIHQKESSNVFNSVSFAFDQIANNFEKNVPSSPIKGIITLEDLIEFWLKIPILDEDDYMHSGVNVKRAPGRRKTFLEIISSKNLNSNINRLYDSKSPLMPTMTHVENNINDSLIINNYHPLNDKNDDENEKLINK